MYSWFRKMRTKHANDRYRQARSQESRHSLFGPLWLMKRKDYLYGLVDYLWWLKIRSVQNIILYTYSFQNQNSREERQVYKLPIAGKYVSLSCFNINGRLWLWHTSRFILCCERGAVWGKGGLSTRLTTDYEITNRRIPIWRRSPVSIGKTHTALKIIPSFRSIIRSKLCNDR